MAVRRQPIRDQRGVVKAIVAEGRKPRGATRVLSHAAIDYHLKPLCLLFQR